MKTNKRGFTILELIVVIAIAAMLFSVIMISTTNTRKKTRDTQRVASMKEISKALNIYYTERMSFPIYDGAITGEDALSLALVTSKTLPKMPTDPLETSSYEYTSDGLDFELRWCMETNEVPGYKKGCDNNLTP